MSSSSSSHFVPNNQRQRSQRDKPLWELLQRSAEQFEHDSRNADEPELNLLRKINISISNTPIHKSIKFVISQSQYDSDGERGLPLRISGDGYERELEEAGLAICTKRRASSETGALLRVREAVERWQEKPKWWKLMSLGDKHSKRVKKYGSLHLGVSGGGVVGGNEVE